MRAQMLVRRRQMWQLWQLFELSVATQSEFCERLSHRPQMLAAVDQGERERRMSGERADEGRKLDALGSGPGNDQKPTSQAGCATRRARTRYLMPSRPPIGDCNRRERTGSREHRPRRNFRKSFLETPALWQVDRGGVRGRRLQLLQNFSTERNSLFGRSGGRSLACNKLATGLLHSAQEPGAPRAAGLDR